jgi:DNA-binding MarR family transcriptional regulator
MNQPRRIGFVIKTVSNQMRRKIDMNISKHDKDSVTGMQGMVIGFIYHNSDKDIFQKDIETQFNIRRSTATGILQLMEKNGFIKRQPVSYDARLKKLILTEKAINAHKKIEVEINNMEERMAKGLTDEEIETFFKLMDKISKNIE